VREARGTQSVREFAKKCGISYAYLTKIEVGLNRGKPLSITLSTLTKLVKAGIEIDYEELMEAEIAGQARTALEAKEYNEYVDDLISIMYHNV